VLRACLGSDLLERGDGAVDLEGLCHCHSASIADFIVPETETEKKARQREWDRICLVSLTLILFCFPSSPRRILSSGRFPF
jgi:hypothetical protein